MAARPGRRRCTSTGGLGFDDLAYASAGTGYVIHFMGSPVIVYSDGLMKTTNAGGTWKNVTIH
jgi:hypothetical protein